MTRGELGVSWDSDGQHVGELGVSWDSDGQHVGELGVSWDSDGQHVGSWECRGTVMGNTWGVGSVVAQ